MIFSLLVSTALATTWLPADTIQLELSTEPVVFEQMAGQRHLLRFDPIPSSLSAWSNGLRLDLADGPDATVLVPAATSRRQIELHIEGNTTINSWIETSTGDVQAWDRYERALWQWIRHGKDLPPPPADITAKLAEWSVRRTALESTGNPAYRLQYTLALLELERVRSRSSSDHGQLDLSPVSLKANEPTELLVRGPGVLDVSIQARAKTNAYIRYEVLLAEEGMPIQRAQLGAVQDLEDPEFTHGRHFIAFVPPGTHLYTLSSPNSAVEAAPTFHPLRPSIHGLLRHISMRTKDKATKGVPEMEVAHLLGQHELVVSIAQTLMNTAAKGLASARLVEHVPEAQASLALFHASEPSPILALSLARRWNLQRDIDPNVILEVGAQLPADPALLASIADSLPAGFFRPRGLAIRKLAGLRTGADVHARWTALWPEGQTVVLRAPGLRGGISRAWVRAGETVEMQAPTVGSGRYPVLRFSSADSVEFLLDGIRFRGAGLFGEAVSPGPHTLQVVQGELLVLDGDLTLGGEAFRERPAATTPASWKLPDLGAPGEVELLVEDGPAQLVVTTSDGHAWEARAESELSRILIPVGPWAGTLEVTSDTEVRVGLAIRRSLEEDFYTTPLVPVSDPLESLRVSTIEMRTAAQPEDRVRARLSRSRSLSTLGLHRSARLEASSAGRTPGATPGQVQFATRLYWESHPDALTSPAPGPTTLATSAARAGIPSPSTLSGLHRLAEHLPDRIDGPVHLALSQEYLGIGQRGSAWLHAYRAGELGRVAKLQIAASAPWQHVARVDADGGSESVLVERKGPQQGDSLLRLAREAMLAAPWPAEDYAVLRPGRSTRLTLEGPGTLELDFLCTDETLAVEDTPCSFSFSRNGSAEILEIPSGTVQSYRFELAEGTAVVHLDSLQPSRHALAFRTRYKQQVLKPTSRAAVHRLGRRGIEAQVAGESLVRVRVHGPEEVIVRLAETTWPIRDVGVVPLVGSGFQTIWIQGPAQAKVSLSRLLAEQPHPAETEERSLDTSRVPPPDPVPTANAAAHINRWMAESALVHKPTPHTMGKRGTLSAQSRVGEDSTGVRDSVQRYRYQAYQVAWLQRLGGHQDWLSVEAQGRFSQDGTAGIQGEIAWVRSIEDEWLFSTKLDTGSSGGAGHLRARAEARRRFDLGANWSSQPFLTTHLGSWSDAPSVRVDPLVWSYYDRDHFFGVGLGNWLDWRPLRDGRLRLGLQGLSTPNLLPNWAEASARIDAAPWPGLWFALTPALGYRFREPARAVPYWRPRLSGQISQSGYIGRQIRVTLGVEAQWLPTIGTLDSLIHIELQQSPARGLRDQSPIGMPFHGAFDLPEDRR